MKRFLALLLAIMMVILAVPVFALTGLAASADPLAEKTAKISISFRMPDARGAGTNIGTLIAERKTDPGFASFELPTADECIMRGVNPDDILGWYSVDANGNFCDALAFSGTYISNSITFYPVMKSSSLNFTNGTCIPAYSVSGGAYIVEGMRGAWSIGQYNATGNYILYNEIGSAALSQAKGKYAWDHGGAYLSGGSGGGAMVLSKTNTGSATTISWTALVDGTVNLDFNSFSACNGGTIPVDGHAFLAVVHNDIIIWPASAAGQKVSTVGCAFESYGWYKAELGNTAALSKKTAVDIPTAYLNGVDVQAGDTIRFLVGRGNFSTAELNPVVTYTETTDNYWSGIITEVPAYNPGKPLEGGNAPVVGAASDTAPEVSYKGKWELITYPSWNAISALKSDRVEYFTKSGANATAFLTSVKDYGSDTAAPFLFAYDITSNSSWGTRWDIVLTNSDTAVGTGGYRYTAEYTGYINASFDTFMRSNFGFDCNYATVRAAIFVDGVMVWPTVGGDATDMTKWAQPFANVTEKAVDVAAELNATIPEIYVRAGQKVDFLLTAATTVNVWNGAGNVVRPAITYSSAFATGFETYATVGEALTMNFVSDCEGGSFAESATRPYLLADSLKIELTPEGEGSVVAAPVKKDGKLTVSVGNIVARRMGEKIGYRLIVDVKMPDGLVEHGITLESGSISPADYLKNLAATHADKTVRDMAAATVYYGAEAQRYFKYNTNAPIDANFDYELDIELDTPIDIASMEGTGDYTFTGASLILGDAIKVKLFINATAAPRADWQNLYVTVDNSTEKYPLVQRQGDTDGSFLKAFVTLPYAEFAADHAFAVCTADGTVVSSVLYYNIDSYAARTADVAATQNVVNAIRALGVACENYANISAATPEGNVVTRVALLSDLHVGRAQSNANAKLNSALQQVKEYFNGETDLILFAGDLTHDGLETEYQTLVQAVTNPDYVGEDTRLGFVLGNHEFYRPSPNGGKGVQAEVFDAFERNLGGFHDEEGTNHMMVINGICFIGLSLDSEAGYTAETQKYLREQVQLAAEYNPNLPIIIYSHYGYGALWGTTGATLSAETAEFLKQYPQIIWFSGHTHEVAQDPRVIGQDYYTSIQLPTEGGLLADTGWQGVSSHNSESSQGMFMTISDTNVVKIYRYDFRTGEQIGQAWTIDIPAILRSTSNFTYKMDDRAEVAANPVFAADASITVKTLGNNSATFEAPVATVTDSVTDGAIVYYYVFVMDKNNNLITSKKVMSEYYRGSDGAKKVTFSVSGLTANTEYVVRVIAESAFEKYSDPLVCEFKTKA